MPGEAAKRVSTKSDATEIGTEVEEEAGSPDTNPLAGLSDDPQVQASQSTFLVMKGKRFAADC